MSISPMFLRRSGTTNQVLYRRYACQRARYLHDNSPKRQRTPPIAFAFDIDGVLIRGSEVIPEATRALALLDMREPNSFGMKIPYILVTNGGGKSEAERCKILNQTLDISLKPTQIIQAHTILKSLSDKYKDENVLVLGGKGDVIRKVAEGYGFNKTYTALDVLAWNPTTWPFHTLSPEERASTKKVDFSQTPISSVLVFHDPRNWSLDIQIICDVLQSGGVIGGPYVPTNANGKAVIGGPGAGGREIELVFCNPDLIWKSEFDRPRLGQGAFKESFLAVYQNLTGKLYPYTQYGKPTTETYRFAEKVLEERVEEMGGGKYLPPVYMIGDNPESDIVGANGAKWNSVLVHTGVYDPARGPPRHSPTHQAANVEEAVRWAIDRELKRRGKL